MHFSVVLSIVIVLLLSRVLGQNESSYRLPNNSYPLKYDLWLKVNIESSSPFFEGHVNIHIKIKELSDNITIHSDQLRIRDITLTDLSTKIKYEDLGFSTEESKDFLTIQLPYTMHVDQKIVLDIKYDGVMARAKNDNLKNKGFMLGTYQDETKESENYIFTEFEPTKARKCFPCYDEPAIKSYFNLQIDHDSSYNAIANMPVISRQQSNKTINHVTTTFRETPKMSTYLIAFVISKFRHSESNEIGIPQKLYARPSLIDKGKVNFVVVHLDRMLRAAEEYFQVPYLLPKMDHVVAPNYFSAIENWGINGYSEDYVLELREIEVYLCFLHEITVSGLLL